MRDCRLLNGVINGIWRKRRTGELSDAIEGAAKSISLCSALAKSITNSSGDAPEFWANFEAEVSSVER